MCCDRTLIATVPETNKQNSHLYRYDEKRWSMVFKKAKHHHRRQHRTLAYRHSAIVQSANDFTNYERQKGKQKHEQQKGRERVEEEETQRILTSDAHTK